MRTGGHRAQTGLSDTNPHRITEASGPGAFAGRRTRTESRTTRDPAVLTIAHQPRRPRMAHAVPSTAQPQALARDHGTCGTALGPAAGSRTRPAPAMYTTVTLRSVPPDWALPSLASSMRAPKGLAPRLRASRPPAAREPVWRACDASASSPDAKLQMSPTSCQVHAPMGRPCCVAAACHSGLPAPTSCSRRRTLVGASAPGRATGRAATAQAPCRAPACALFSCASAHVADSPRRSIVPPLPRGPQSVQVSRCASPWYASCSPWRRRPRGPCTGRPASRSGRTKGRTWPHRPKAENTSRRPAAMVPAPSRGLPASRHALLCCSPSE